MKYARRPDMEFSAVNTKTESTIVVSIIIPVFDNVAGLEVTLESLRVNYGDRHNIEVIVCNDGGGEPVSGLIRRYHVKEAKLDANAGSYAARNAGIVASAGNILAFIDADQRVSASWLEAGLNSLREADYVGGKVVVVVGDEDDLWQRKDRLLAFPVEGCLKKIHFAPTANLFVRREVIQVVGGFDARLRSSGDVDFGQRVYRAGFRQLYAPEAMTYHPARNKDEQLKKMRRVGSGAADKMCLADRRSPLTIMAIAVFGFAKLPFELAFRVAMSMIFPGNQRRAFLVASMLMYKYCKGFLLWHMYRRARELRRRR